MQKWLDGKPYKKIIFVMDELPLHLSCESLTLQKILFTACGVVWVPDGHLAPD